METSPAFATFSTCIKEAIEKFTSLIEHDENLWNEERIDQFLSKNKFSFNESREEIVQSILNKTFHEKFMKESGTPEVFPIWEKLANATTKKENTSKIALTVGAETSEIQKNEINLEFLSDTQKQITLLNKHLSTLNPDVEIPFVAVKLYSANPSETKDFLDGLLEMADPLLQSIPLPVVPELSVIAGSDHVIVNATFKKSLETTFMMIILCHLTAKLPEYDVELRLKLQAGTNFKNLIENHTDNTVFDLLNGFKVSLEFMNNISGFLDEIASLMLEKGKNKDSIGCQVLSFIFGSVSLNSELNLSMGANEIALMANLPKVNIFDREGILSVAPFSLAKQMREDEMGQMILPNLSNLEGRADIFVSCPFFTLHMNVEASGTLELVNSTIDLFNS